DYAAKTQLHILGRTDGLVLGVNPKGGVLVKSNRFLHPDMNISIQLPQKWEVENTPVALTAIAKNQKSGLMFGADVRHNVSDSAAQAYMKKIESKKIKMDYEQSVSINGFAASRLVVSKKKGTAKSVVVWVKISDGPGLLQLSGTASDEEG